MPRRERLSPMDQLADWVLSKLFPCIRRKQALARQRHERSQSSSRRTPADAPYAQTESGTSEPIFDDEPFIQHQPPRRYRYKAVRGLLTNAERDFFHVLDAAVGDRVHIFTKVRVLDLLDPDGRGSFYKISQKHIDFVICERSSIEIRLAIELDDRSHQQPDRIERDNFLDAAFDEAEIPLLRCRCRRTYDVAGVRSIIERYL